MVLLQRLSYVAQTTPHDQHNKPLILVVNGEVNHEKNDWERMKVTEVPLFETGILNASQPTDSGGTGAASSAPEARNQQRPQSVALT